LTRNDQDFPDPVMTRATVMLINRLLCGGSLVAMIKILRIRVLPFPIIIRPEHSVPTFVANVKRASTFARRVSLTNSVYAQELMCSTIRAWSRPSFDGDEYEAQCCADSNSQRKRQDDANEKHQDYRRHRHLCRMTIKFTRRLLDFPSR
jgi:hypothetical protein